MQQHAEPVDAAVAAGTSRGQQVGLKWHVDNVVDRGGVRQLRQIEIERQLALHAERRGVDQQDRIGQRRNVLVHKFICQGTVEERIDRMIESKQQLVTDLLEGSAELQLTELSDRELLALVKLDIHAAQDD